MSDGSSSYSGCLCCLARDFLAAEFEATGTLSSCDCRMDSYHLSTADMLYLFELEKGWYELFDLNRDRLTSVLAIVEKDHYVVPSLEYVFKPFSLIGLSQVHVVIVGQNPYDAKLGMANGIPFALNPGQEPSATINTINEELRRCYGKILDDYSFEKWISQGVLLLNSAFTATLKGQSSDINHKDVWVFFVQNLLHYIAKNKPSTVFMLWGKEACGFTKILKGMDVTVIKSPFPLDRSSSTEKFVGSNTFVKCDKALGESAIRWV